MEKIRSLIAKLQELEQSNASLNTLSYYTQLLYAEIMRVKSESRSQEIRAKINVSVILPTSIGEAHLNEISDPVPGIAVTSNGHFEPFQEPVVHTFRKSINREFSYPPLEEPLEFVKPVSSPETRVLNNDIPVREKVELNEKINTFKQSLNEKLKKDHPEIAEHLSTSKVADLQDAITLNDKFLFINELFRGDRNMYERSIRTINGFNTIQEAEYWIERELKIKMGWAEENGMVRSFYSLVRKRFP